MGGFKYCLSGSRIIVLEAWQEERMTSFDSFDNTKFYDTAGI